MSCRAACRSQKNASTSLHSRSLFHVFIHVFEQVFKAFIVQLLFVIVVKLRDSMITFGGSVGSYHDANNGCRVKHNEDDCLPLTFPLGMWFLRAGGAVRELCCCTSPQREKREQKVVWKAPLLVAPSNKCDVTRRKIVLVGPNFYQGNNKVLKGHPCLTQEVLILSMFGSQIILHNCE